MDPRWAVVALFCLGCVAVRTAYEQARKAGRLPGPGGLLFVAVFVAMVGMLLSWPVMGPLDPCRVALPSVVRVGGFVLATTGMALAVGGLAQLRGVEDIDHLVCTGLYRVVRHPMYVGFILWIAGWGLAWGALQSLAVGLLAIANILYWRHLEEAALESRYGSVYRDYRRETSWMGILGRFA